MFESKFEVVQQTVDYIYIRDVGGNYRSVTNDAEKVIEKLTTEYDLGNRRAFYMDTEGQIDELLHKGSRFTGFKFGHEGVEPCDLDVTEKLQGHKEEKKEGAKK